VTIKGRGRTKILAVAGMPGVGKSWLIENALGKPADDVISGNIDPVLRETVRTFEGEGVPWARVLGGGFRPIQSNSYIVHIDLVAFLGTHLSPWAPFFPRTSIFSPANLAFFEQDADITVIWIKSSWEVARTSFLERGINAANSPHMKAFSGGRKDRESDRKQMGRILQHARGIPVNRFIRHVLYGKSPLLSHLGRIAHENIATHFADFIEAVSGREGFQLHVLHRDDKDQLTSVRFQNERGEDAPIRESLDGPKE
jgi:hypothetical protein